MATYGNITGLSSTPNLFGGGSGFSKKDLSGINLSGGGGGQPNPINELHNLITSGSIGPSEAIRRANALQSQLGGGRTGSTVKTPPADLGALAAGQGGGAVGGAGGLSAIDLEFNEAFKGLGRLAGEARTEAGLAGQKIGQSFGAAEGDIRELLKNQIGGLQESAGQIGRQSQSALSQAGQTFNELQQRNLAQLSAGGISDSSASEALQERLGRDTFAAINNITQNRDVAFQNIEREKTKTNDFYNRKLQELTQAKTLAQKEVQLQLQQALNRIKDAKGQSTVVKQQARTAAIQAARSASGYASNQLAAMKQQVDSWSQGRNQILDAARQFTTGQVGMAGLAEQLQKYDTQLRQSSGVGIDIPGILNSVANPTGAALSGQTFYQGTQQQNPEDSIFNQQRY